MASDYVASRHDIGITNANGDVVGLMIAQRKDGTPGYAVFDRKHLADQFFTGTHQASYQDPEIEIPISQYSWRAGLGLKVYDNSQPERYNKAVNCDLRTIGKAMLSYQPFSATKPVAVNCTVVNPGFEISSPNNGWYSTGAQSNYSDAAAYAGNYSWLIHTATMLQVNQDVIGWAPGVEYKLECAINVNAAPVSPGQRAGLSDGINTVW